MKVLRPIEMQKAMIDGLEATEVLDAIIEEDLEKAKKEGSQHVSKQGHFKGAAGSGERFKSCMAHQQQKGLSEESARKLCAYIGRRAGKIA